jgi:hypothetical protein
MRFPSILTSVADPWWRDAPEKTKEVEERLRFARPVEFAQTTQLQYKPLVGGKVIGRMYSTIVL